MSASSRLSAKDRRAAEVAFFGPLVRRVLHALDLSEAAERKTKAEVKDLRARLRWIRTEAIEGHAHGDVRADMRRATDLRAKNWRRK